MVIKNCLFCSNPYSVKPYAAENSKFCSYVCYWNSKKKQIIKKCLICNKKISCDPSREIRKKYCSVKCQRKGVGLKQQGELHHNWKGGTHIGEYLYVKTINHPNAHSNSNYVAQHRLVMEDFLGRYLTANEEVHHKNGIKDDNRIENLELVVKKMHFGVVKCPHCQNEFKVK